MDTETATMLGEILLEGFMHSVKMLPVLFPTFLLVEIISHRAKAAWLTKAIGHPTVGPLLAAGLGLLPQCGFSVAATTLYLDGLIPTGSLISAYIATSDEALPILLSDASTLPWVMPLLLTKLVWGAAVGVSLNLAMNQRSRDKTAASGVAPLAEDCGTHAHRGCVGHSANWKELLLHSLSRTTRIGATVFVLSTLLHTAGEFLTPGLTRALAAQGPWQSGLASIIGLFPSCATSVALAEGFRTGYVSFSAMVSGLVANAGIGLLVLVKESKDLRKNISVIMTLVMAAFTAGLLAALLVP